LSQIGLHREIGSRKIYSFLDVDTGGTHGDTFIVTRERWRWLVAGGWWLVAGGWWLVDGGWLQVAGGWWLVAGGWWLVAGGWWLVAGGWWLVISLRCRGRMWGRFVCARWRIFLKLGEFEAKWDGRRGK
jgi:hypothetical protein